MSDEQQSPVTVTEVYFVVFSYNTGGQAGQGSAEIGLPAKITTSAHVRTMEAWLRTQGTENPLVTWFTHLRTNIHLSQETYDTVQEALNDTK